MIYKFFKKSFKKFFRKKGATLIIAIGLSALLIVFSVGVAITVQNSTNNIKAFKHQWEAQLMADSVKEKMLLLASQHEAGFSLVDNNLGGGGNSCEDAIIDKMDNFWEQSNLDDNDNGSLLSSKDIEMKCSIDGKNDEPVYVTSPTNPSYTVPKANTGDAGANCTPLQKFVSVDALNAFYNTNQGTGTDSQTTSIVHQLFNSDPLNHPCNWGKLKFGSDENSKVVVPLYYAETGKDGTTSIKNPKQIDLNTLRIRVRPPCKPIKERSAKDSTGCLKHQMGTENYSQQIDTNKPECRYEDICLPADRYTLDSGPTPADDETIVLWQISGECTLSELNNGKAGSMPTETCALLPDDGKDDMGRSPLNSEIYESLFGKDNSEEIAEINQNKTGKIAYYEHIYDPNKTIKNFILQTSPIGIETGVSYTAISKPILTLSMAVDSLKDINEKQIPYLEYQIVTDKPISNISQQFKTEINYKGQSFIQTHSIDQKKNIVDFALQD